MIHTVKEGIYYVEHEKERICPKIGIITGSKYTLIVDVANEKEHLLEAERFLKENGDPSIHYVALTHFHPDHIQNVSLLEDCTILCSRNTSKYLSSKCEIIVEEQIDLGNQLVQLVSLPSLHAKGCIGVLCDGVLFVGDALYSREKNGKEYFNKGLIGSELKAYKELDFQEVIFSHGDICQPNKAGVLAYLANMMSENE